MQAAVKTGTTAADALAYAVVTDKVLHRPATQHTGYSKLASHTSTVHTDLARARHTADPTRLKRKRERKLLTRLYNKATCPDWLWTEDRQIKPTVFAEIQALSGRTFTLDAAANEDGSNAHCTEYCSPANSFLDKTHTGHLWINAPFTKLLAFTQHYLHCKQLAPGSTSACILVPGYLLKPMRSYLTDMHLLKRHSKGAELFTTPTKSGGRASLPGVHWPVYVYTDIPAAEIDRTVERTPLHSLHNCTVQANAAALPDQSVISTDKHLTLLFEGRTGQPSVKLRTLMDTGASACFVSPRKVQELGLKLHPADATLRLADNTESPITGKVQLRIRIQHFSAMIWCFVTELCADFDVILGNSFLTEHKTILDFKHHTVSLTRDGKKYKLKAGYADKNAGKKLLLNSAQARRSIKNGCDSFLVLLNAVQAGTADDTSHADTSHTDTVIPVAAESDLADIIASLRQEFADIFEPPTGLPPDRGVEHVVSLLPGSQPPFKRMYRLSPEELAEVKKQIADLLARGLIELSTSPYGSPILFVKKKTGELRMVVDYRELNKLTVKNRYPLPRIDDLFDKLHGAQYFTSLDAASGFHQILLKPDDRPKTAFRTPFGHYQFKVLPFGLTNAPATFQAVMNRLFDQAHFAADGTSHAGELLSDFVLVFVDDILIFSKTAEDHARHLRTVFELLRKEKLQIKPSKCVWGQTELPYLGFIVGKDGIKPDPKKVEAVTAWPTPTSVKEVQQFLGLTNFFRKFILGYSNLTAPLTELTKKKVSWNWSVDRDNAFRELKTKLTAAPVLAIPDPAAPFELITDSCGYGIGAVLMQNHRPVAYYSRKMTDPEKNYVNHEQELLAAIVALKVFRCYLLGNHFTLITDNKPNTYLDSQPTLSRRQARWSEYLQRFHYTWVHKPGKFNVADPLSRNPSFKAIALVIAVATRAQAQAGQTAAAAEHPVTSIPDAGPAAKRRKLNGKTAEPALTAEPAQTADNTARTDEQTHTVDTDDIAGQIAEAYAADPIFADEKRTKRWTFADNLWWDHDEIVVPDNKDIKRRIMSEFHDSVYAGHLGVRKTVKNITRYFTWPNIWADTESYIAHCPSCQVNKGKPQKPYGQLQPNEVPPYPWHTVTTDYVTGLPLTADKHDAIAVFVDALTKYIIIAPCTKESTGADWAHMFMNNVHTHFGLPKHILSDRGPQFTSLFNKVLAERLGYSWKLTTAYAPWSDGQTERANRLIEDVLRHFVAADMQDWDLHLPTVQFAINNAWQETVQETPMFLNRGRHPKTPLTVDLPDKPALNPFASEFADQMRAITARAKRSMFAAQMRQKRYYDKNRTDKQFAVGDKVLLSTANLALKVLRTGVRKLAPKWVGPFTVIERIGSLGYRLELPATMTVHNVFHACYLRPYKDDLRKKPPPVPELDEQGEDNFEVDRILDHAEVKKGNKRKLKYLLRFTGYGPEEDMWTDDVSGCAELLQEYWDRKKVTERLHAAVCVAYRGVRT